MTREEIYDKVNACETLIELSEVIIELTDEEGYIQGRKRKLNGELMAQTCINFNKYLARGLTREFGIRQQALYITRYL